MGKEKVRRVLVFEAEDCNDPLYDHIVEILKKYDPSFVYRGRGDGDWINLAFDVEEYQYKIEDNNGDDAFCVCYSEEEALTEIESTMQTVWDLYCSMYPDKDVTWLNRYLDCGDTTEIYVPGTDEYTKVTIMW